MSGKRRDREEIKKMGVTKLPSGGAGGWIPAEADESLALDAMLVYTRDGEYLTEYFKDLTKRRRAKAGKAGALAGAVELPDELLTPVITVIPEPPDSQREIIRAIRDNLDEAIVRAKGPGVFAFKTWYVDNGHSDSARLVAMLDRSINGFKVWLETFPP